jgi:hypothetical protein
MPLIKHDQADLANISRPARDPMFGEVQITEYLFTDYDSVARGFRLFTLFFGEHCLAVAASEFLYPTRGIDKFLFTREKGVASCANSDFDIPASRSCAIRRATCTSDRSLGIVGMNISLHVERTRK